MARADRTPPGGPRRWRSAPPPPRCQGQWHSERAQQIGLHSITALPPRRSTCGANRTNCTHLPAPARYAAEPCGHSGPSRPIAAGKNSAQHWGSPACASAIRVHASLLHISRSSITPSQYCNAPTHNPAAAQCAVIGLDGLFETVLIDVGVSQVQVRLGKVRVQCHARRQQSADSSTFPCSQSASPRLLSSAAESAATSAPGDRLRSLHRVVPTLSSAAPRF